MLRTTYHPVCSSCIQKRASSSLGFRSKLEEDLKRTASRLGYRLEPIHHHHYQRPGSRQEIPAEHRNYPIRPATSLGHSTEHRNYQIRPISQLGHRPITPIDYHQRVASRFGSMMVNDQALGGFEDIEMDHLNPKLMDRSRNKSTIIDELDMIPRIIRMRERMEAMKLQIIEAKRRREAMASPIKRGEEWSMKSGDDKAEESNRNEVVAV